MARTCCKWKTWRGRIGPALWALLISAVTLAAADRILFKPVTRALLKIDDKPAKIWEVYQGEKHAHLVLVQLGQRFLLLETKEREILELAPAALEKTKNGLVWKDPENPSLAELRAERESGKAPKHPASNKTLLPSDDWALRSVGPLVIVKVKLAAEGRVLEVQLPQRPDLRWAY